MVFCLLLPLCFPQDWKLLPTSDYKAHKKEFCKLCGLKSSEPANIMLACLRTKVIRTASQKAAGKPHTLICETSVSLEFINIALQAKTRFTTASSVQTHAELFPFPQNALLIANAMNYPA